MNLEAWVTSPRAEASGGVVILVQKLLHPFAGTLLDAGFFIDDTGDGAGRNAGLPCNIVDRHIPSLLYGVLWGVTFATSIANDCKNDKMENENRADQSRFFRRS